MSERFSSGKASAPSATLSSVNAMPAISLTTSALLARATTTPTKHRSWAKHEGGVILVFCIIFIIAAGLIGLCLFRMLVARRAKRQAARA
ncbi:hypothetical protein LPUS_04161 [Lasallia pustulata]|uniref:Uncharacterized protein n=1 Tax=Lasallia pustulata TaxID=136370 RepID=A0A1W5CWK6_9LECA|nr:hypothetical protein LPUS_04161 [Lasallia pustulata]